MGIFWVSQKRKKINKIMFQKNTKALITNKITKKALQIGGFSWFLQESNQGHTDFQSVALPTELRNLKIIDDSGFSRNRTRDTLIFSPLLYQLS